ncbi:MAG: hypothetical protein PF485_09450 [Bacteroidales bacterium]|jgi:hypothetical protein|nr:hypothetical protein [Bacteroidales bacterium]
MEYIHGKKYESEYITIKDGEKVVLQPVVRDLTGCTHFAPFIDKHIQVNKIVVSKSEKENTGGVGREEVIVEAELVIFDRYHIKKREAIVKYKTWSNYTNIQHFTDYSFHKRIELMNKFIELGGDINDIKMELFKNFSDEIENNRLALISMFNEIEFKFYKYLSYVPRKDDIVIYDAEIKNYPLNDNYASNLFKKCLKKYDTAFFEENNMISLEIGYSSGWYADVVSERIETDYDLNFKNELFNHLIENYDPLEHSFELLKSEAEIWT